MSRIESAANPLVKRIRALVADRKAREREGTFFVEGIAPVWQAVESGAAIEMLVVAPELLTSAPAQQMIAAQRAAGTRIVEIGGDLFGRVATREHPSGLGAIVRMAHGGLGDLAVSPDALFVALDAVGNPGNLGTILRTVDAVGGNGVVLLGETTDPYHPNAVKASMGTLFRIPLARVTDTDTLFAWCQRHGVAVVTTSAHAPQDHWAAAYPSPALVLFGSEAHGLPAEALARGDLAVRIPMRGGATSLNLAVSVGVLLYEIRRQREEAGCRMPDAGT